jgi:hypothetical protein
MRELLQHTVQVANAIAVAIIKASAVDLVYYRFLPPFFLHKHASIA